MKLIQTGSQLFFFSMLRGTSSELCEEGQPLLEKQSRCTPGPHLLAKFRGSNTFHKTLAKYCFAFVEGKSHQTILTYIIIVFHGIKLNFSGPQSFEAAEGSIGLPFCQHVSFLITPGWVMKLPWPTDRWPSNSRICHINRASASPWVSP